MGVQQGCYTGPLKNGAVNVTCRVVVVEGLAGVAINKAVDSGYSEVTPSARSSVAAGRGETK